MECKHGTHEPCDLCAEEDAERDREMAIQARIDAAVAAEHERMLAAIADDAYASTFQSMGQYRSALLRALRA